MLSDLKNSFKQTQQLICNIVMVKRPTTSESRCYTTLWCVVNHNTCFTLLLYFWFHRV